ncbi:MAG: glutamate--tRNA ligase [Nitrospira sp.]|nr:glutamate--tRNA ligase [bacterium]MBL7049877.1 glutamate--tRNA ligase [Nitrospira sp.]
MTEEIRVRFAPSPTGHLHIGGARTALFNWLYARHNNAKFVLRIEDTDRARSTDEYIDAILEGMKWLGLDCDEGPFRQTDRFAVYNSYADKLLEQGRAYHCYCSPEELDAARKKAMIEGRALKYNGKCRGLKNPVEGISPVVRFAMPQEGSTAVQDLIKGVVEFDNEQLDDLIIRRSDGTPTYNLTVVVDDVDMHITHVIRGDDHLNNTPRQIQLYQALGYEIPKFAHLPMILGADKARLSKRHGATSVMAYQEMGYLPEALVNYLVRLGWSYGDQEVFSMEELVEHFSLENVGKAAAIFNPEKLLWMNSQYIIKSDPSKLAELVIPFLVKEGIIQDGQELDMPWLCSAIITQQERQKTLIELAQSLSYYIEEDVQYDEKAKNKFLTLESRPLLKALIDGLEMIDDLSAESVEAVFNEVAEKHEVKLGKVAQPARVAFTGITKSPGIFDIVIILGKEKSVRRLRKAMEGISENE